RIAAEYPLGTSNKALAITTLGRVAIAGKSTRAEAVRLALERCSYHFQRPCLILAIDDSLTVQIPRTRKVSGIFLPSVEREISDSDRARIGRVYRGKEWRALARGRK